MWVPSLTNKTPPVSLLFSEYPNVVWTPNRMPGRSMLRSRRQPPPNLAAQARAPGAKTAMTYFKPKNLGDVRLLLGGIDDNVPVTLTSGVQLPSTVRTVGDLRRLTAWPTKHRLVVERAPFVEVRVELGRAVHHA